MSPGPQRVRVVIPCRNEAGYIGRCLRSLIAADRLNMELEAWVCDGLSEDDTRAEVMPLVAAHPWIRLVDNPERTTPQAMNIGLRPGGYEVGIILGAHAEVDVAFFQENLRTLAGHPQAGCVGGIIENVYTDAVSRRVGAAMGHPFGVGGAHFRTGRKEGEVDTVAFGAYRRAVFEQVGYFDERLVRNQDDEFNYRVTKAGWKIILSPRIRSRYYVRASYERLFRQYRQYGFWKVYVNKLHGSITTLRQLVPALWVAFLLGGSLGLLHPWSALCYFAGVLGYLSLALFSAVRAAAVPGDIFGVLRAFLVLHFAYGLGYLHGVWSLLLLGREPASGHQRSTR